MEMSTGTQSASLFHHTVFGMCLVLYCSGVDPHSADRQEEANCRFKGVPGENKPRFPVCGKVQDFSHIGC